MRQLLQRFIREGIVSRSQSDYCSPAFVIPKKDGTGRLLIDCRELNKRLRKNAFPIPRIQQLLDRMALHGAKIKSTLVSQTFSTNILWTRSRNDTLVSMQVLVWG